jgi:hypothetical protein
VVEALDLRLHYRTPGEFFERHPEALEQAQRHAVYRREQGLSHGATLREYALLRQEIWTALGADAVPAVDPYEFFQVERAINATLDGIVTATAAAYAGEPPPPAFDSRTDERPESER